MRQNRSISLSLCWLLLIAVGCAHKRVIPPSIDAGSLKNREQVVQLLIHQGYRDIRDLHRNGEDWIGVGTKHGQVLNFDVDKTGAINPVSPQHNP